MKIKSIEELKEEIKEKKIIISEYASERDIHQKSLNELKEKLRCSKRTHMANAEINLAEEYIYYTEEDIMYLDERIMVNVMDLEELTKTLVKLEKKLKGEE